MPESFATRLNDYLSAAYPILAVETHEEMRVVSEIRNVVANRTWRKEEPPKRSGGQPTYVTMPVSYAEWDSVSGMIRIPLVESAGAEAQAVNGSKEPPLALNLIKTFQEPTVVVMKDIHPFIEVPSVWRTLRNIIGTIKESGVTIIFISPRLKIAAEIAKEVQVVEYRMPSRDELALAFRNYVETNIVPKPGYEELVVDPSITEAVAESAMGMTSAEADNAFALATIASARKTKKVKFDQDFVRGIFEEKIANLKNSALEYKATHAGFESVGGLEAVKAWSMRRRQGFSEEARRLRLPYPKGVLLAGIKGCGKTSVAQAIAHQFGFPLFMLDIGKLFASKVGESLHPDEEVYVCDRDGTNTRRFRMEDLYAAWNNSELKLWTWTYSDHGGACRREIKAVIRHERQERFVRVETDAGRVAIVTEGHSLFTLRERPAVFPLVGDMKHPPLAATPAGKLSIGDKIATVRKLPEIDPPNGLSRRSTYGMVRIPHGWFQPTEDLMVFFGLWLANGSLLDGLLRLSVNADHVETITPLIERVCRSFTLDLDKRSKAVDYRIQDRDLAYLAHTLGLCWTHINARKKRVPDWVFGCEREMTAAFLRGYFSGDGSMTGHVLEATSANYKLALDIQLLLSRLDIVAHVGKKPQPRLHTTYGRVYIAKRKELAAYAAKVGFLQPYKTATLVAATQNEIPDYGHNRVHRGVYWDTVKRVTVLDEGPGYSYDLSVADTEKFVTASGVIAHNTEALTRETIRLMESLGRAVVLID